MLNITLVMKTTDGGINWFSQNCGSGYTLHSVYFPDDNIGYAVGQNGNVIKTTDSGISWSQLSVGSHNLYSVYFTDINTGHIVCTDETILKTTDGGLNWAVKHYPSDTYYYLTSVYFPDANTGYAVGHGNSTADHKGVVLKTTDGGEKWELYSHDSLCLNSVFFTDVNTGYVVGEKARILKTTDGAANWTEQHAYETICDLNSVYFTDANNGYAVGIDGTILKTTDGGVWITEKQKEKNELIIYPNPVNNEITIELEDGGRKTEVGIYNVSGQILFKQQSVSRRTNNKLMIDVSDFPTGIYFIKVVNENGVSVGKIIKE